MKNWLKQHFRKAEALPKRNSDWWSNHLDLRSMRGWGCHFLRRALANLRERVRSRETLGTSNSCRCRRRVSKLQEEPSAKRTRSVLHVDAITVAYPRLQERMVPRVSANADDFARFPKHVETEVANLRFCGRTSRARHTGNVHGVCWR